MKWRILLVYVLLTNYCLSQSDKPIQFLHFSNQNYKLQYPASWALDTSKQLGVDLFIFSPLESESDKFRDNVNVLIQDLSGQAIDLEKYKQITEKQITELDVDGEIFESSLKKSAAGAFYRINYAMTQGTFRLNVTSICFIDNGKTYLATFSAESSRYDGYKETAEQILDSFRLIK